MQSRVVAACCREVIDLGDPLSFTGDYSRGLPLVKIYDGYHFYGISLTNVVHIDDFRYRYNEAPVGGIIDIATIGCEVSIPSLHIKGLIDFNSFIQPVKQTPSINYKWKVTKKRTKYSVGLVTRLRGHYTDVKII